MSTALILLPTHDHQDTLWESIEAVRRQTIGDWELVAILDGSPERTLEILRHFARLDRRISFVERPKGPRLGEAYRDAVIRSSAAPAVLHATDDDLWLPSHLRTILELLEDADFAHTALLDLSTTGTVLGHPASWASAKTRQATLEYRFNCTGPNQCGYRREAYLRLERGWETTPAQCPWTDAFMWAKFLREPGVRVAAKLIPTGLKFGVLGRDHWSPPRRREELARWTPRLQDPSFAEHAAARADYGYYYRWAVGACDALESDLASSLLALGVVPVFDVPLASVRSVGGFEPAELRLTRDQARELETAWRYLSGRMAGAEARAYLLRQIELNPADDAALRRLVEAMAGAGESEAALRLALSIAERAPLKGRRWRWIEERARQAGHAALAEEARRREGGGGG
jgi:glycosyltransferase involved in cell wall biosynthesis